MMYKYHNLCKYIKYKYGQMSTFKNARVIIAQGPNEKCKARDPGRGPRLPRL